MPRVSKKAVSPAQSLYGVHPGVYMVMKWVSELKEKTGRTLQEWQKHIIKNGPDELRPRIAWLQEQYGIGSNTAWWLASIDFGLALGNTKAKGKLIDTGGFKKKDRIIRHLSKMDDVDVEVEHWLHIAYDRDV